MLNSRSRKLTLPAGGSRCVGWSLTGVLILVAGVGFMLVGFWLPGLRSDQDDLARARAR
jgi:hypothetical protein